MVEIYSEKGCVGCMRSSPVASMIGLIIVLFGIGAFGGGFIITWKSIGYQINNTLFTQMEYVLYGVVVAVVLFTILSYILAALSSGYNRKRFFEGSRKAKIGRCFTVFNMLCLMMGSFTWMIVTCAMSFCLIASVIVHFRLEQHETDRTKIDLSYYGLYNHTLDSINVRLPQTLMSVSFAFGGSLIVVLGFMQMLCCAGMNYVRLSEERYYDNNSITQDKSEQVLSAF